MSIEHYDKCVLLLPMKGENNGTSFPDFSQYNKTPTVVGDAKTVTEQSKYYGSSIKLDGTGDYLYMDGSSVFSFGTGDFTMSCWLYLPSTPAGTPGLFGFYPHNTAGVQPIIYFDSALKLNCAALGGTVFLTSTNAVPIGQWVHIEWSRVSGVSYLFINGVANGSVADTRDYSVGASRPVIGANAFSSTGNLNAYLQDVCMWKGVGLHSEGFTPPTQLVGSISGTITGLDGNPAKRTIVAVPRAFSTVRVFSTVSDDEDGTYSLDCINTEMSRIVLAGEADLYNDIVDRVLPG
jgi:hypothetical protein